MMTDEVGKKELLSPVDLLFRFTHCESYSNTKMQSGVSNKRYATHGHSLVCHLQTQ